MWSISITNLSSSDTNSPLRRVPFWSVTLWNIDKHQYVFLPCFIQFYFKVKVYVSIHIKHICINTYLHLYGIFMTVIFHKLWVMAFPIFRLRLEVASTANYFVWPYVRSETVSSLSVYHLSKFFTSYLSSLKMKETQSKYSIPIMDSSYLP